ncbi:UvrD-like helicase C-terminal domain-containing protein [Planifilum fulgidum]|uniref:DNA 3'-5' helicase n=1 Tax=Planifilum fulgidum TaxID=201973 RepID=A0A1I2N0S6_9BACL|nr:ATP-dependent helicase [Planifilum fulgidum]SFF96730.1 UvrD-like helicase C-terminal domain-containing protein [Planifilum fulgidum]
MPTIALQDTFLEAFERLPRSEQRRTRAMIDKMREDLSAPGLNFERYNEALDPKVYSVRVSQSYRAIAVKPDNSDTIVLVWVDHHDEAYRWVKRKRFEVNVHTGAFQMWTAVEGEIQEEPSEEPGLFTHLTDHQLIKLGVPPELVPVVKRIRTLEELDAKRKDIPADAWEALNFLATGESYEEVLSFMEELRAEEEDGADPFERAVKNRSSSRSIVVITDDEQLNEILNQPLEKWRTFLHPTQKELVEKHYRGPIRVLGGAGTGKTVVVMHRARRLVRNILRPDERVLVTTYTVNLAESIREHLKTMCTPEEMERIDVIPIDRLARQLVDQYENVRIEKVNPDPDEVEKLWMEALEANGWSQDRLSFVMQEYDHVIQSNGVDTWEEYLDIPRTGRGQRISRAERKQIWDVVCDFRRRMQERGWYAFEDILRLARKWVKRNRGVVTYRSAVVDEAQDFHAEGFKLLRELVPEGDNDLFIVGDAHQRIYSRHVVLGRCGINIRGQRSKRLRLNYRTTEQIRDQAIGVLHGLTFDDLDGGIDQANDRSLIYGEAPERVHFTTQREEQEYVIQTIRELLDEGVKSSEIAVLARSNWLAEKFEQFLKEHDIPAEKMGTHFTLTRDGVSCGTMHRAKGLEFRVVFLVGVSEGLVPPQSRIQKAKDPLAREQMEREERSLLYVAATRARDKLFVTSSGTPCRFWPVDVENRV